MLRRCFIIVAIVFSLGVMPAVGLAATYTSSQDGDWDDSDTWGGSGPPTSTDDVLISGQALFVRSGRTEAANQVEVKADSELAVALTSELAINELNLNPGVLLTKTGPGSLAIGEFTTNSNGTVEIQDGEVVVTAGTTQHTDFILSGGGLSLLPAGPAKKNLSDSTVTVADAGSRLSFGTEAVVGKLAFDTNQTLTVGNDAGNLILYGLSGAGTVDYKRAENSYGKVVLGDGMTTAWDVYFYDGGTNDRIDFASQLYMGAGLTLFLDGEGEFFFSEDAKSVIATISGAALVGSDTLNPAVQTQITSVAFNMTDASLADQLSLWYENGQLYIKGLDMRNNGDDAAAPEPATWLMLALGVLGLGIYRRRKR